MRLINAEHLISEINKMECQSNVPIILSIFTHMKENIIDKINAEDSYEFDKGDSND